MAANLSPDDDAAWAPLKALWQIRPDTIYLNHGSYGPSPISVREIRRDLLQRLDDQPMDFFMRTLEPAWHSARDRLAEFVGTSGGNLIFVENATVGMNVVAESFPLSRGDEVLLTDHEYGAVRRIWQRACGRADAEAKTVQLPLPFRTTEETVDALFAAATDRTRLIVVSHIASPTAVILPVKQICERARRGGIAVAIDGPHAPAQVPLAIDALGCEFYMGSCHKWLCAPFGSGFLYVAPQRQSLVQPPVLSWGRQPPTPIECWADEFVWEGTRDPTAYLAVPAAIEFMERVGLDSFRARTHWLAQQARRKLMELTGLEPIVPDDAAWYGTMAHAPLPPARDASRPSNSPSDAPRRHTDAAPLHPLQQALWREFGIEVPVIEFRGQRYIRVSCHLYNDTGDVDGLIAGLGELLAKGQ